ncbi:M23 family metallopeptidase [Marinoscillum sp.]|uniref:M23 family metallopeptidase n=1 Tax=Marinoscillum sp. TaxID=2024838 RepID=UPI003BAA6E86
MKKLLALITILILAIVIWSYYDQFHPIKEIVQDDTAKAGIVSSNQILWPLKPSAPKAVIVPSFTTSTSSPRVRKYQVKYGDSFHRILQEFDLPDEQVHALAYQISKTIDLNQFQVGNVYRVKYDESNQNPVMLTYDLEQRKELTVDFVTNMIGVTEKEVDIRIKTIDTPIRSSLAQTVLSKGAPENLADKILSVFAWKIDFSHLMKEDHFKVIYEEEWADGEMLDCRNILAIHFTHDKLTYSAYGFDNGNGWEYFDPKGENMSHAPLVFDQITSLYAQKRFHPTRRSYKAHYGMDFEANLGTPIEALKDGIITRARYGRANGNNVKIKHSEELSTQYLHMTKIDSSIHLGDSVEQGQVIGYVGSTGWSSGPHLCLRVWYKGKQRDPLDFDFPKRPGILPENEAVFFDVVRLYSNQLTGSVM